MNRIGLKRLARWRPFRPTVVVKLRGGLGNQMFQYAAARRLADVNDTALWLDASGFSADTTYRRRFCLDDFEIRADRILERPFAGSRRKRPGSLGRPTTFEESRIHSDEALAWERFGQGAPLYAFEDGLLGAEASPVTILDGSWQSESYFADDATRIRRDFRPTDGAPTSVLAREILSCNAVCVGVRLFEEGGAARVHPRLSPEYYERSVGHIVENTQAPHFFVFSTDLDWARSELRLPDPVTYIAPELAPNRSHIDLVSMALCHHFVIPNSTYHWWGAWLGAHADKIVVAPSQGWGNSRPTPPNWIAF